VPVIKYGRYTVPIRKDESEKIGKWKDSSSPCLGSHLTIWLAGSKQAFVISDTDSCSWYAFSALKQTNRYNSYIFDSGIFKFKIDQMGPREAV